MGSSAPAPQRRRLSQLSAQMLPDPRQPVRRTPALPGATAAASAARDEPRVFVYDDGRHASPLYQFAPPLSPDDFVHTVDQFAGSGIDTLFCSVGLEGGPVHYDSKVAAKWGANVKAGEWTHLIFYRASRNLHQLVADGHDPLQLLCDRAHHPCVGLFFLPSLPVCTVGQVDRASSIATGRTSDFAYDTSLHVGPEDDPAGPQPGALTRLFKPERLDFLLPEVRAERFAIFEELLREYDTDGVELDLSLEKEFGPLTKLSRIDELAPVLTAWIRRLKAVAVDATARSGRRKRLYVRIPAAGSDTWAALGFEVAIWVEQGLVDGLVAISPLKKQTPTDPLMGMDQDLQLQAAASLTCGSGTCRLLAGFSTASLAPRPLLAEATTPMIAATALNAYDRGADGFGLVTGMCEPSPITIHTIPMSASYFSSKLRAPNGWPLIDADYGTLRLLGLPALLATTDKIYRAWSQNDGSLGDVDTLLPPAGPTHALPTERLPATLLVGVPQVCRVRVADELQRWAAEERLACLELTLVLSNFEHCLNTVEVKLNGTVLLQDSAGGFCRWSDLHFHVLRPHGSAGTTGPYGYSVTFSLEAAMVIHGENIVQVTLTQKDHAFAGRPTLADVDIAVSYRPHRHFESPGRNPLRF